MVQEMRLSLVLAMHLIGEEEEGIFAYISMNKTLYIAIFKHPAQVIIILLLPIIIDYKFATYMVTPAKCCSIRSLFL